MKRGLSGSNAKRLWIVLLILAAVGGGIYFGKPAYHWARATYKSFTMPSEQKIAAIIERMADSVNIKTPKKISSELQLIRVIPGPGRRIEYVYQLIGPKSLTRDAFGEEALNRFVTVQGRHVKAGACAVDEMRRDFFANGVLVIYAYVDKNGDHLAKFEIRAADCGMGK